jgi:hypothetical protein
MLTVTCKPYTLSSECRGIWLKDMFTLAKVSVIMPATATHDCTYLGHLGRRATDSIISILCCKVAKASTVVTVMCRY